MTTRTSKGARATERQPLARFARAPPAPWAVLRSVAPPRARARTAHCPLRCCHGARLALRVRECRHDSWQPSAGRVEVLHRRLPAALASPPMPPPPSIPRCRARAISQRACGCHWVCSGAGAGGLQRRSIDRRGVRSGDRYRENMGSLADADFAGPSTRRWSRAQPGAGSKSHCLTASVGRSFLATRRRAPPRTGKVPWSTSLRELGVIFPIRPGAARAPLPHPHSSARSPLGRPSGASRAPLGRRLLAALGVSHVQPSLGETR